MTVVMDSVEQVTAKNGTSRRADRDAATSVLRVAVEMVGITPLLMNRMSEETIENLRSKTKAPKTAARPTPREECEPRVHTREGKPAMPAEAMLSCLIAAGQYVRLDGKRQVSTASKTMLPAFLSLEEPFALLRVPGTTKAATWEVDLRAGRNPNGGEAVAICRPRFDAWAFSFTVQIDTAQIGEATIRELFAIAGRRIGLLDFRPSRKGLYGQFSVNEWKVLRK